MGAFATISEEVPALLLERSDDYFMGLALREAAKALEAGEVPIGAVIAHGQRVIAKAHNQRETLRDPTAHAEMIALSQAAAFLDNWRLLDTTLYVSLEPCAMCAGAIVLARVKRLVYGAPDPKAGACGTLYDIVRDPRLNHQVEVTSGVCAQECAGLLHEFFRARRGAAAASASERGPCVTD